MTKVVTDETQPKKVAIEKCNQNGLQKKAMTREEIIHVYENSQLRSDHFKDDAVCAAYIAGLAALREQEERENPKPLTIEELRQMKGEPVWVQGPGIPEYGRWAIVEDAFGNSLFLVNDFTCHDIGKTWEAYRYKPKEG